MTDDHDSTLLQYSLDGDPPPLTIKHGPVLILPIGICSAMKQLASRTTLSLPHHPPSWHVDPSANQAMLCNTFVFSPLFERHIKVHLDTTYIYNAFNLHS
jgi:hypothetical protein